MNIVVLCGGTSTERAVSIISGTNVCKALRQKGHNAILLDAFAGNEFCDLMDAFSEVYDTDEAAEEIRAFDRELTAALKNKNRNFFGPNVLKLCKMADFVFMALHGANGEDGRVQAAFDLHHIRYTGTGYLGSAISMDKGITKIMLKEAGIPVPKGFRMEKAYSDADLSVHDLDFPVVVKVNNGGSSVGVFISRDQEAYERDLEEAFEMADEVVVEEFIEGREFSVGVIDGKALPIIEIAPVEGFYDYKNKYTPGSTIETCPAVLSEELTKKMQRHAEAAYHALFLNAYGRCDFMMKEDGSMYCLEANTLPGMTETSLLPQEAAAVGVDYPDLCEKLIEISMNKYR